MQAKEIYTGYRSPTLDLLSRKRKPERTSLSWMARIFSSEERQVGGGKRRLTSVSPSYVLKNRPGDFAKCISIFTTVDLCPVRSWSSDHGRRSWNSEEWSRMAREWQWQAHDRYLCHRCMFSLSLLLELTRKRAKPPVLSEPIPVRRSERKDRLPFTFTWQAAMVHQEWIHLLMHHP